MVQMRTEYGTVTVPVDQEINGTYIHESVVNELKARVKELEALYGAAVMRLQELGEAEVSLG